MIGPGAMIPARLVPSEILLLLLLLLLVVVVVVVPTKQILAGVLVMVGTAPTTEDTRSQVPPWAW